ncbi:GPI transamidase component PIG-T [Anoplolepis gracilipes]|uniref:GPI transamidase component PIG-T n=1 Tax=Anoplolepis gracilipes TaxID=354296 RepID=UPI003BA0295E
MLTSHILLFTGLIGMITCNNAYNDFFDEELMLKPLSSNHIYAYFQFTTIWKTAKYIETLQHSHLFPRGLGEIIGRHNIDELHVTLTEGLWNYQKWGYPFHDAGPGAEITAWFNKNVTNIDKEWKGLTNALAGLFCASLNFIDISNSMSPEFTFRPTGLVIDRIVNASHLRYSSLPKEVVCTENLTPFKKLLPCDSKRGLATLLNSAHIHNTNYHSIGIHFRSICRDITCTRTSLELRQTVSLTYDIMTDMNQDWSIRKFFGMGLQGACPLATLSNVYVDISSNNTNHVYELTPPPSTRIISLRGGQQNEIAVYDIRTHSSKGIFNIAAMYNMPINTINYPSILYANRYIIGYGQERGSLVTKLYNNHWQTLDVILLENIPWYLLVYLHSITITQNGQQVHPLAQRYLPGKERKSPYYLELILRLPPHSIMKITIDIDYLFLKWQEYPPDANHGFYMGPAIVTALLPIARNYTALPFDGSTINSSFNASRDDYLVQLRTESLLISLPTPDFSMPYNVICLACTAVALAFGPLHNISTKRLVLKRIEKDWKSKLLSFFIEKIFRIKRKQE